MLIPAQTLEYSVWNKVGANFYSNCNSRERERASKSSLSLTINLDGMSLGEHIEQSEGVNCGLTPFCKGKHIGTVLTQKLLKPTLLDIPSGQPFYTIILDSQDLQESDLKSQNWSFLFETRVVISLRASSPIWASEASLARTRERASGELARRLSCNSVS